MGLIYRIINLQNNKIYIGKTTVDLSTRWSQHIYEAKTPTCKGYNFVLHKAIRKYGKNNFSIEVIDAIDDSILEEREKFWISYYNCMIPNGYNMTFGGEGSIKIDRDKVRNLWNQGTMTLTDIANELQCSKEAIRTILRIQEPTFSSDEAQERALKKCRKKVYQYSLTGELINIYPSIAAASTAVGVDRSCISRVCSGKKKTSKGFLWSFTPLTEEVLNLA